MDNVPEQEPDPQEQKHSCPHCGAGCPAGARVCPNCGSVVATESRWPPSPKGADTRNTPAPVDPELRRREVNEGVTFGCSGLIGAWVLVAIFSAWLVGKFPEISGSPIGAAAGDFAPVAGAALLYFLMRRDRPNIARGLGYAILIGAALALGALVVCSQVTWPPK